MSLKELCRPCAALLGAKKSVTLISSGRDRKITCGLCGRRRFGATFDVKRKQKKEN